MRRIRAAWIIATSLILSAATVSSAEGMSNLPSSDPSSDVEQFARAYGISVERAQVLFTLGAEAGKLEEALAAAEADVFAGIWLQHQPEVVVVVASTSTLVLDEYVDGTPLEGRTEVRMADYTLQQLEAVQQRLIDLPLPESIDFATNIDIQSNVVAIEVTAETMVYLRQLQFDAPVVLIEHENPLPAVAIYGGLTLSNGCTTGSSIDDLNSAEQGVSTAAHCDNTTSWNGYNLPWQAGQYSGSTDPQWPLYAEPHRSQSDQLRILHRQPAADLLTGEPLESGGGQPRLQVRTRDRL